MLEKINEFDWSQSREKYANYDKWAIPSIVQENGLTFITDRSIDYLTKGSFVVIGGDRNSVLVYGKNASLSLEYECRKDNDMAKVLTEEIQKRWLSERNKVIAGKLLSDIRERGYLYTPLYGVVADNEENIRKIETLYIIYPYIHNTSDEKCSWAEIYGFALAECRKYKLPYIYSFCTTVESRYVSPEDRILNSDEGLIELFYGNKYNCLLKRIGPSSYNAKMAYTQRGEVSI